MSHRYPLWLVGCPQNELPRLPDAVDAPRLVHSSLVDRRQRPQAAPTPSTRHDPSTMRASRALRNSTETAKLQRDTRQQQESLNALRAQMRQEKERREAEPRPGGTRWGSASVKKGSLGRSYGKDVRKKLEQRTASGQGRAAASRRDGRFWDLPVQRWSVADAGDWLVSLDLAQYGETFARNEISGRELLDLGLDDLDYMGVKALAHRKRLLKGVAELCAAHRRGAVAPQDPTFGRERPPAPPASSKVHWSAVPTLQEQNPDAPNPQPHAPQRLADAGGMFSFGNAEAEVLDEAAERKAFQEAVAAWCVTQCDFRTFPNLSCVDGVLAMPHRLDALEVAARESTRLASERRQFRDAIVRHRRSGNNNAPPSPPSPVKCGDSLLDGEYDEAAEQAAFQEAVAAWRTRGAPPQPREATSSPKKLNTVGRTANDVADELARQLDAMNAAAEASLRRRRREAEASLAEVERLRAAASEPLVLEAVDSDSDVEDAPQSCRIVHETTALGSHDADAAAYFVDEASDSNDDANDAPAYVVDEGSDTE